MNKYKIDVLVDQGKKKDNQDALLVVSNDRTFITNLEEADLALNCISQTVEVEVDENNMLLIAVTDGVSTALYPKQSIRIIQQELVKFASHFTGELNKVVFETLVNRICKRIISEVGSKGATTLSMLVIKARKIYMVNIGDSPIIKVSTEDMKVISETHTMYFENKKHKVNNFFKALFTRKQYLLEVKKSRHTLSRWVPLRPEIAYKEYSNDLLDNVYILASDGLYELFDNKNQKYKVLNNAIKQSNISESIFKNRMKDPRDNTTIVSVRCE